MLPKQGMIRSLCYLDDKRSAENDKTLANSLTEEYGYNILSTI
jgi:hypothetical protein